MEKFYDKSREKWIADRPEEKLRHRWYKILVEELLYPSSLVRLEASIKELKVDQADKHLLPCRRIDIVVYAPLQKEGLQPFLLIECKKGRGDVRKKALHQVHGYNRHIQAPFVAAVNEENVFFACVVAEKASEWDHFLSYKQAMEYIRLFV